MTLALPRRWQDAGYAGLLVAAAIGFLWVEHEHGLTFPIPWPDEGSFLWPALSFRDHLTLHAPEVNPQREIFWMPPGFMVLEGIIFKILGFSLLGARFLSAVFVLLAMACLAVQVRSSRARFGHALLIAIFLFAPILQMVGNTARMESIVLFLCAAGFLLLDRGRAAGLGVLATVPLVHPNGVLACAGGAAYWIFGFRGRRRPNRVDLAAFAVALVCWALYAWHASRHGAAFLEDMRSQVRWKQAEAALNGTILHRVTEPFLLSAFAGLVVAFAGALFLGARGGALFALGLPFLVVSGVAVGWLYDVYAGFGALLASMLVLEAASALASRFSPRRAFLVVGGTALLLCAGAEWVTRHPYLMRSVTRATTGTSAPGRAYFSTTERRLVETYIRRSAHEDRPVVVQFLPDADSLLFQDLRSSSIHLLQQTYFSTRPDVYILHDSPWFPPFLRDVELADFAMRNRVSRPLGDWDLVAYSSVGGRWIAVQHDGPGMPWY